MIILMRVALVAAGSRGDVQPLLALGIGLRERGHEVRLAAPAEFEPLVEAARLEYRYLPGGPATMRKVSTTAALAREIARSYDENLYELLKKTAAACRSSDVVIDTAMSHTDAITSSGVPWCTALLWPITPTAAFPAMLLPDFPIRGVFCRAYNRLTHRALTGLAPALARSLGMAPRGLETNWQWFGRDRPGLYAFSPTVVAPPQDWPPNTHVTGYWFWDRAWEPPKDLVAFLDRGPAPVAMTLGSLWIFAGPNVVDMAAAAARRVGRRLLLLGGREGVTPADVLGLDDEVDHAWLFPRVVAVIHHGGAGTTAAAARAGVPQVIVPCYGDQPFWARRMRSLGVAAAPIPIRRLTAERLGLALDQVLNDTQIGDRAAELARRVRRDHGVEVACGVIEEWAARAA
jgi:UDP:flavonoid glycosyltransferase YjiC (YdhE family)